MNEQHADRKKRWAITTGVIAQLSITVVAFIMATNILPLYIKGHIIIDTVSLSSDKIMLGESVDATYLVKNYGTNPASISIPIIVDGVEKEKKSITLDGKGDKTVSFDLSGYEAGYHVVECCGYKAQFKVQNPAQLEPVKIFIEPTEITVDSEITICIIIRNTGDVAGSFSAPLLLDGVEVSSIQAQVNPGEEIEFEQKLNSGTWGTHSIKIGDLITKYSVTNP